MQEIQSDTTHENDFRMYITNKPKGIILSSYDTLSKGKINLGPYINEADLLTKSNSYITPQGTITQANDLTKEVKITPIPKPTVVLSLKIKGESFNLTREEGEFILTHPSWSLTGSGNNLIEAEMNLFNKARIFLEGYSKISITELSHKALQFRNFLFSIV